MSEFIEAFGDMFSTPVFVEKYRAAGFDGAGFEAGVWCAEVMHEDVRKLVRGPDGNEVLSETTIYVSPEQATNFNEHARVTVNGRVTKVAHIASLDVFGLPGHVVVNCE